QHVSTGECQPCRLPNHFLESGYCHECRTCEHEVTKKCTSTSNEECSCRLGFDCTSLGCETCVKLPHCGKGTQLIKTGNFNFLYSCQPCTNSTYSDTVNGTCKPFIKCHSMGLDEVFPGNKTHNAKCGIKGLTTSQDIFIFGSIFIGLICLLMLLAICAWRNKSRTAWSAKYTSRYKPRLASEAGHLPLSVEEKGTKISLEAPLKDNIIMPEAV
ncbi:tumor necrosis factor receptor superfamily member 9-like, partial [Clupea harengus]|uniref:Tumor necrosis factor receptor superfamily member 9-like n=1 Tax=Clupea harengus TaxID=7950 RepID=A0A8M1KJI4_CLUHA